MLILIIVQLDITLEFNFIYFCYISACNLVSVLLCVTIVKVIVNACANEVKWNYLRLILNQKEPYTVYAEN